MKSMGYDVSPLQLTFQNVLTCANGFSVQCAVRDINSLYHVRRCRVTPLTSRIRGRAIIVNVKISVECYSGYRGEETPRRLIIGEQVIGVVKVLDQWLAPDHRYFKVEGDDGSVCIVRHDMTSLEWELTLYDEKTV